MPNSDSQEIAGMAFRDTMDLYGLYSSSDTDIATYLALNKTEGPQMLTRLLPRGRATENGDAGPWSSPCGTPWESEGG